MPISYAMPPGRKTGLIPRDFSKVPHGCLAFAPKFDLPIIPRSEWAARIAQKDAAKSWLSDVRDIGNAGQQIPALDQDGRGDCWCFSSTNAVTLLRACQGEPYVPLCGTAVAYIIQPNSEGGNGIESLEWIVANGVPSQAFWPEGKTGRSYDTPQMRTDAAKRKVQEWRDLDPNAIEEQVVTCLLNDRPVVADFDDIGHSMCLARVRVNSRGQAEPMCYNSWSNSWGMAGMAWMSDGFPRCSLMPQAAVCPLVTMAS